MNKLIILVIPNYLDVSIRWLSILLLNTFASVMFFILLGKLLYNLAPRKAKDLWPVLRREKGTLRSQEFHVTLFCILDRRTNLSEVTWCLVV